MADSSDPRDELIPDGSSQSNGSDPDGDGRDDEGGGDDGDDETEWEAEDGVPFAGGTADDSNWDADAPGDAGDEGTVDGDADDGVDDDGDADDAGAADESRDDDVDGSADEADAEDDAVEDDAVEADDDAAIESRGDGGAPATGDDVASGTGDDAAPATAEDLGIDGIEGPESDEEMPLAAHIEEMMRRLAVVFLFGGLATLVAVTESTGMINYFWSYHIPAPLENRPRLYGPLELPLTRLKVAGIAGVVVGLPAFVYQSYRFMKPGLYETERRYYLAAVPTSLILGGVGVAFAHFLVLPAVFSYFTTYTSDAATVAFGLAETFNLIVIMLAFMAIVFQIPLFIMLAIMMDLVTRRWLEDKRLLFWGAFLGIAFLFSPDPTGMAPIIVTLTMIALYEGTLAALRWTGN